VKAKAFLLMVSACSPMTAGPTPCQRALSDPFSHASDAGALADTLRSDPVYGDLTGLALARLLTHVIVCRYAPGESIYVDGDPADFTFITLDGMVMLTTPSGSYQVLSGGRFGDEAACSLGTYATSARAEGAVRVGAIERSGIAQAFAGHPRAKGLIEEAFIARLSGKAAAVPTVRVRAAPRPRPPTSSARELIGWFATSVVPIAVLALTPRAAIGDDAVAFLSILSATISMWAFGLVDEFVPALIMLFAILALGLAPASVVLGGFASETFFMTRGILALGGMIATSGLSFRLLLLMLERLPATQFWQNAGLMAAGIALTPVIPSTNGRVGIASPFVLDMIGALGFPRGGNAALRLSVTAFAGVSMFSSVFMTGKPMNLVVHGLLPESVAEIFQWTGWLAAAAASGVAMLAFTSLITGLMLPSRERSALSKPLVAEQLRALGAPQPGEWAAAAGIGIFAVGVLTSDLHKISAAWLSLAVPCGLLVLGLMSKRQFRENVDWPLLLYTASLVGLASCLKYVGLDVVLAQWLAPVTALMHANFALFLAALFGAVSVLRLVIPTSAATIMLAAVLLPVANSAGVSPWLVGFVILNVVEFWFFPFQCSYYLQFRDSVLRQGVASEGRFLIINAIGNGAKLAALYASIPFWKAIGLL
jgi:DASS family divalent anion:Na+ symporter